MKPDITVLIPLHDSLRFIEVVRRNIGELSPMARVIVSDPLESDGALRQLERDHGRDPNVTFVGRRELGTGWVPHYNDLLSRTRTPFFMWLAHDDEIDASYLSVCRERLRTDRALGGVVGHIEPVRGEGLLDVPQKRYPDPSAVAKHRFYANALLFEWNLGVLFRAVFRTKGARPVPETYDGDQYADIVWAYGFCLDYRVAQEPSAVYRKRFFPDSTHQQWNLRVYWAACLPHFAEQIERSNLARGEQSACRSELLHGISATLVRQLTNQYRAMEDRERPADASGALGGT